MRGSLDERSPGVWRLRVFVGRDVNGRAVHRTRTFRGGKRAAETALAKFVAAVNPGAAADAPATVADLLAAWLTHQEHRRTPATMKGYRGWVSSRIVPAVGAVRLEVLSPLHLDRAYRAWGEGGLSATSVSQCHRILSAALGQAVKWGWLDTNPAERASPPSPRRHTAQAVPVADVRRLVDAADEWLRTVILLAALTGCRRGELCALRWSDVDFDHGTLRVERSVTVLGRHDSWQEGPTKTHQERQLALDPVLADVLRARRLAQLADCQAFGGSLPADAFILGRLPPFDIPTRPDLLTHQFSRLCARLGLDHHLHELRHFAATVAIAAGVDVRSVAARLGHADPSMTLRVYAGALEAGDRRAADALGRALSD